MQMQASLLLSRRGYMGFCSQRRKKATNQCILKKLFLVYMRVFCLHVYMYTICVPAACGDQKRALNSLELELWTGLLHEQQVLLTAELSHNPAP